MLTCYTQLQAQADGAQVPSRPIVKASFRSKTSEAGWSRGSEPSAAGACSMLLHNGTLLEGDPNLNYTASSDGKNACAWRPGCSSPGCKTPALSI